MVRDDSQAFVARCYSRICLQTASLDLRRIYSRLCSIVEEYTQDCACKLPHKEGASNGKHGMLSRHFFQVLAYAAKVTVHYVLENFQRPHGPELSTFLPASTELGECYWESLQLVLNSESVSVTPIARCYLSILFVETLGSVVTSEESNFSESLGPN